MKYTEECVMGMEKLAFVKKNPYKWAKLWLKPGLKRQLMEWKHIDFPVNKKFQAQHSVKKMMLTVFWDIKGPITIIFLKKGATINRASVMLLVSS